MGARRRARERAMQMLYQMDVSSESPEHVLKYYWKMHPPKSEEVRNYTLFLFDGTVKNLKLIDELIVKYSKNWKLSRMPIVDRNILRLAVFELLFEEDVPPSVAINEALEIARRFSNEDSTQFINGVLDAIYKNFSLKEMEGD